MKSDAEQWYIEFKTGQNPSIGQQFWPQWPDWPLLRIQDYQSFPLLTLNRSEQSFLCSRDKSPSFSSVFFPWKPPEGEAGDVWCLPPVWNLRAVIWFHFAISSLVLQPSPVTLSVLSFSACWPFLLNCFQKILQYFSLGDGLFCMAPV